MTAHHDGRWHDEAGRPSDSAGQAWAGKTIPSHGFADDTGEADAALLDALAAVRDAPTAESESELVARVAAARWLVPVVAVATEVATSADPEHAGSGLRGDTLSEMAAVTLIAPDGARALPVFSSIRTVAEWDPEARPVPVPAASAARAAITEDCQVLVVDIGSAHATVLRPSMLWALAQERAWRPSHADLHVTAAVASAVDHEPDVVGHRLEAGEPAGAGVLRIVLAVRPGLDAKGVGALATRIGERIATDGETRARIDALTFALESAG